MSPHPSLPESLWNTVPPEAQAAILVVIASLEKRIADLEARLNQNSTNSSKPPSTDPPAVKVKRRPPAPPSGRKRGGQPGHKRLTRALVPPEQLRETCEVKPTHCGGCDASLQGADPDPVRHQVAEIPPVRPDVDEYRLHRLVCPCWGTVTCAGLPAGVPAGPFGPRLRAILALFAGSYRLAKRPIQQLASDLFGLDVSLGMISKLERRAAEVLEPVGGEVAAAIVAAPSAPLDETSWSEANEKAWLWIGQTDDLTAFTIAANRGADVARAILGINDLRPASYASRAWIPDMNPATGWTISPFPVPWDLLFNFDDLSGSGRWYRMTGFGAVTAMPFVEGASVCVLSPGGARARLIGIVGEAETACTVPVPRQPSRPYATSAGPAGPTRPQHYSARLVPSSHTADSLVSPDVSNARNSRPSSTLESNMPQ